MAIYGDSVFSETIEVEISNDGSVHISGSLDRSNDGSVHISDLDRSKMAANVDLKIEELK